MTPRQIRFTRQAERFMPRLWDFAYPPGGRGYGVMRRIALRAYCRAVQVRWLLFELR